MLKFEGYYEGTLYTYTLEDDGTLMVTSPDGTCEAYNDSYYTEDDYSLIRFMLIRDGVQLI